MGEKTVQAVEKVFGKTPENVEKIEEGLMHETYSLEVEGQEFILQFSGKDDENHSALGHCLKMYQLLEGTVPVPKPVTRQVQEIDGDRFIIVEKIPGISGEQNISPEKTRKAGKTLAKIHNFTDFEKDGWIKFNRGEGPKQLLENIQIKAFEQENLKGKKLDELDEKLEVLDENGLENVVEKTEKFIEENQKLFPTEFGAVLIHNDFTPDNVIYRDETISGIIDFDYAYSGLDARNIVKSANGFWMHDPGADCDIRKNFYDGYREERPLPENFEELEKFFRIETLVHLIGSMIQLDELTEDELDFYREEILKELEASKQVL